MNHFTIFIPNMYRKMTFGSYVQMIDVCYHIIIITQTYTGL